MSLLGLPMYKLNLWCMIVPPLGSHGRLWGFAPWPPMTACGRHNHTPQVQFTHMRPCKDMQNMLYSYSLSSIFIIHLLSPIVYVFWYELTRRRFDCFLIKRNLYLEWSSPVSLLPVNLYGYVTVTVTAYVTDYSSPITE